jgi:hypothetical protein
MTAAEVDCFSCFAMFAVVGRVQAREKLRNLLFWGRVPVMPWSSGGVELV